MSKRERTPCDMKTCKINRGSGFCGAVSIWVSPDKSGRPICQTYDCKPGELLSAYDVEAQGWPEPLAVAGRPAKTAARSGGR